LRRRYIAVKIDVKQNIEGKELINAVSNSLLSLFGEYGASLAELTLIEHDPDANYAIFRCNHKALEMAKASIIAVREINRKKAATQIIYVSGTIKALKKKVQPITGQQASLRL